MPRTNGTRATRKMPTAKIAARRATSALFRRVAPRAQAGNSTLFLVAGRGRARESHIVRCIARMLSLTSLTSSWRGSSPDAPHNRVPLNGSRGHFDIYRVCVSPFSISFSRPPSLPPSFPSPVIKFPRQQEARNCNFHRWTWNQTVTRLTFHERDN